MIRMLKNNGSLKKGELYQAQSGCCDNEVKIQNDDNRWSIWEAQGEGGEGSYWEFVRGGKLRF